MHPSLELTCSDAAWTRQTPLEDAAASDKEDAQPGRMSRKDTGGGLSGRGPALPTHAVPLNVLVGGDGSW